MVLVEPTRHLKTVAGKIAARRGHYHHHRRDVLRRRRWPPRCTSAAWPSAPLKPATDFAVYTVGAGTFADAAASGANEAVSVDWVAPAKAVELVSVSSGRRRAAST